MFSIGDAVICVDASDIPSPPWKELKCGASYIIREIEEAPKINGLYDKNIYKNSRYLVRLWGITNPINPNFNKELGYADGRFEKIESNTAKIEKKIEEKV